MDCKENCSTHQIEAKSTWLQAMQRELTCGTCLQIFQDPVNLPCGHEICKRCVKFTSGPQPRFECVLCNNNELPPPTRSITENPSLKNLCQEYRDYCQSLFCAECKNDKYWLYICSMCSVALCEECMAGKCSQSAGVHSLVKDNYKIQNLEDSHGFVCENHPEEDAKYICLSCKEFFCGMCSVIDKKHVGEKHQVSKRSQSLASVENLYRDAHLKLDLLNQSITRSAGDLETSLSNLASTEEQITKQSSALKLTISRLLDCHMLRLLKCVHTQRVSRAMMINRLEGLLSGIENLTLITDHLMPISIENITDRVNDLSTIEKDASNMETQFKQISDAVLTLRNPKLCIDDDVVSKFTSVMKSVYSLNDGVSKKRRTYNW